ncbi:MAG: hypothetical protein KIT31_37070 [Deltaproteobacteria bacterium]|nr:hypothetical protein [Deltaproteobacteria bacterium]
MQRLVIASIVALTVVCGATASADSVPHKPILVFESYTGQRPDGIATIIGSLNDELEAQGFAAHAASIIRAAGGRLPRPGILDPEKTAAGIARQVETAYEDFVNARYRDAKATLTLSLQTISRNPGLVVVDTSNADVTFKALATLALCQKRLGEKDNADTTMKQLIRMFPTRPLPRVDFGPDGEKLQRDALESVLAMGRGRLSIFGGNAQSVIFVHGQIRGIGKAILGDLVPGTYHVFVQVPGTAGRQYELEVTANEEASLYVESELDDALWVTDRWVGFQFASDAERGKEARYASTLAKRWTGADIVAVIGTAQIRGRSALIGTLYRTTGHALRSAFIELDDRTSTGATRALAHFLADGTPADGLQVLTRDAEQRPSQEARPNRFYAKALAAAGITMIVAGGVLIAYDEDPVAGGPQRPTYRDSAPAGVVLGTAGVILSSVGTYLWLRKPRRTMPVVAVTGDAAVVGLVGRF